MQVQAEASGSLFSHNFTGFLGSAALRLQMKDTRWKHCSMPQHTPPEEFVVFLVFFLNRYESLWFSALDTHQGVSCRIGHLRRWPVQARPSSPSTCGTCGLHILCFFSTLPLLFHTGVPLGVPIPQLTAAGDHHYSCVLVETLSWRLNAVTQIPSQ